MEVTGQSEPGDIRRGPNPITDGDPAGDVVQGRHRIDCGLVRLVQASAGLGCVLVEALECGRHDARADGLRQQDRLPGPRCIVRHDPVRVDLAEHGLAEHRLWPVDRMSTYGQPTALGRDCGRALEHLGQDREVEQVARPRRDVEREQGAPAHCVHIAGRVRRCDCPPGGGVIDDWGEEVDRCHHGPVIGYPPHGGVVAAGRPYEQIGVARYGHVAQHECKLGWPELAGTAGAVAVLAQTDVGAHRILDFDRGRAGVVERDTASAKVGRRRRWHNPCLQVVGEPCHREGGELDSTCAALDAGCSQNFGRAFGHACPGQRLHRGRGS